MKIAVTGALPHELKALLKHVRPHTQLRTDSFPTVLSKSHSREGWHHQLVFKWTTQPSAGYPGRQRGAPPASGYPGVPGGTSRRAIARHPVRTQRQRRYTLEYESVYQATYLSHEIVVVLTGVGTRDAKEALTSVLDGFNPDLILSIGFGGALYEGAHISDLVMATSVSLVSGNSVKTIQIPDESRLLSRLGGKTSVQAGSFFTLETLMAKTAVKPLVPTDTAFPVCEMETFPLAELARARQIPFLALRSITDRLDEEIPPEFLKVTDRAGRYRAVKAAGLLLSKPRLIPMAAKLATRSRKASEALWQAFDTLARML